MYDKYYYSKGTNNHYIVAVKTSAFEKLIAK